MIHSRSIRNRIHFIQLGQTPRSYQEISLSLIQLVKVIIYIQSIHQQVMRTLSNSLAVLFLALLTVHSSAFAPRTTDPMVRSMSQRQQPTPFLLLYNQSKKKPYDEKLRKKLLSESIAPWRTIRLFLYGSLGSGAFVGGFIQLTGLLAALSKGQTDIDMNTEVNICVYVCMHVRMRLASFGDSNKIFFLLYSI
jgi:hypothetical protein